MLICAPYTFSLGHIENQETTGLAIDCLRLASVLIGQGPKHGVCVEHVVEGLSDSPNYILS